MDFLNYSGIALIKLICPGAVGHTEHILKFNETNWSLVDNDQFQCRPNLINKTLTVVAMGAPPYVNIEEEGNVSGTEAKIIEVFQSRETFNLNYEIERDWLDVEATPNGQPKIGGLVGKVHNKEAHLGIASMIMVEDLYIYVDFMLAHSYHIHYKTGKPKNLPPYWNLIKPFSNTTWITVILTLIFMSVAFILLSRFLDSGKRDFIMNGLAIIMSQFCQGIYASFLIYLKLMTTYYFTSDTG